MPAEIVLPWPYYAALALQLAVLVWLHVSHPFRAGDRLGHAIGWVGTGSMVLMHVYSLRRRVRALARWGPIRAWLEAHIFLGLQGAMLVTFHSLHLSTLTNLSGLTLAMTLVVVASGIFGRYLFAQLPRSIRGERLSAAQVNEELEALRRLGGAAEGEVLRRAERRRISLERRLARLTRAERLFRNWTVLHKPLTFLLLGAVLLHVFAHYLYAAQFSG